jgi:hypothetical protein
MARLSTLSIFCAAFSLRTAKRQNRYSHRNRTTKSLAGGKVEPVAKQREIERLFPDLPPLAAEPIPVPGPSGQPYTLADLQQIAATNSPHLRQAASDVDSAMLVAEEQAKPTHRPRSSNAKSNSDWSGRSSVSELGVYAHRADNHWTTVAVVAGIAHQLQVG